VHARIRTVSAGRHDEVGDGAVEVGVDDGRRRRPGPWVGAAPAEAPEHAAQLAVVQLGEVVQRRDAAGRRVVASGADASPEERQGPPPCVPRRRSRAVHLRRRRRESSVDVLESE